MHSISQKFLKYEEFDPFRVGRETCSAAGSPPLCYSSPSTTNPSCSSTPSFFPGLPSLMWGFWRQEFIDLHSLRFLILELVVACHYLDYTLAFRVFGETRADHSQHHGQDSDRTKENLITYVEGQEAIGMPSKLELSGGKRKESTQQKASPTVIKRKGSEEYEKHHKIWELNW